MIALLLAASTVASPASARAVVGRYYRALEQRAFRTAYRCWAGDGAASGQSFATFRAGFARTAHTRVVTGEPGRIEGAAGSLYVTVPVTVTAVLKDGSRQRFHGRYTLRRVNDVAGATLAQRQWHLAGARLRAG